MNKVYIDGQSGTTVLEIVKRLQDRSDIKLLMIPEDKRKDVETRKEYLNNDNIMVIQHNALHLKKTKLNLNVKEE